MQEAATDCFLKSLVTKPSESGTLLTRLKNYVRKSDKNDSDNLIATAAKQNADAFWQHVLQSFDRKKATQTLAFPEEKTQGTTPLLERLQGANDHEKSVTEGCSVAPAA